jgi:hypothetical protein
MYILYYNAKQVPPAVSLFLSDRHQNKTKAQAQVAMKRHGTNMEKIGGIGDRAVRDRLTSLIELGQKPGIYIIPYLQTNPDLRALLATAPVYNLERRFLSIVMVYSRM